MEYRIRRALQGMVRHSYLKDEGTALEKDIIDCSLGINPCGVTPKLTKDMYAATFDVLASYPAHPYVETRRHICEYFSDVASLDVGQLSMQSGSMSALRAVNSIFLEDGTRVLAPQPCFSSYTTDARACGAEVDVVPLREENHFAFPVDEYVAAISEHHRLAYLDNPNNPTGQALSIADLRRILTAAREKGVLVLVDEAYGDFLDKSESALSLLDEFDNLIVTRTFSKGFGLGALRAGYIAVPKAMADILEAFGGEMNLTTPAAAMVPVVLSDPAFLAYSRDLIAQNNQKLISGLNVLKTSATRDDVPITLFYTEKDVDLGALFWKYGIRVENGVDFEGIGKRHVRLRVPQDITELARRLERIEAELQAAP